MKPATESDLQQFVGRLTEPPAERARIDAACPGWSDGRQWDFFAYLATAHPRFRDYLMLGVYRGRDLAYLSYHLRAAGRSDYCLVGVDKFTDTACADWPDELRGKTWREAGFGEPPSLWRSRRALDTLRYGAHVMLVKADAADFLRQPLRVDSTERTLPAAVPGVFDCVYIDTAHDHATVRELCELAVRRVRPGGVVAGDDYADDEAAGWGVRRAVAEAFPRHELHGGYVWSARVEDYRGTP